MDIKKTIGTFLVILGVAGLASGVFGIFEGQNILGVSSWAYAILGLIFFSSGVGLLRSIKPEGSSG